MIATVTFLLLAFHSMFSQSQLSLNSEDQILTVEDAPDTQVIAISKTVVVKKAAKEVFAWGGDVIVEGRIEGDVATIGGSVIQKEGAFIGGDVIVFGGQFKSEGPSPLRTEGKQTVVFGVFEEELRNSAQDPSQILSPKFSVAFLVQRIFSAFFWFILTLGVATIAPGAIGRTIVRLRLSTLKVVGIGTVGLVLTVVVGILALSVLPEYLSAITGLMAFTLLMLAYGFGRIAIHLLVGRYLTERIWGSGRRSESVSILIGVLGCTLVLSLPYVWALALFLFFSAGVGLVLSARPLESWRT